MKKTILAIMTITFASCDTHVKPGSMYPDGIGIGLSTSDNIRYFYDAAGQKCFAERGVSDRYSFTCVPCDSAVLAAIKYQK
jgi:hypothetical protein